ncbi:MAG: MBL fold metallo-hydrolase [Gammaproteobacteria bacterium CG_4_10_14_0_8_um_filter_38_16]|nr:MAG: MBL fold metallo-hydrolase [Gammaproteobacteria bacterium CG_4_10_14_0_8_um_filter_38_16]PJA02832.1 MAG: MBL fold metallo-hydrolase [Gammaproteobacteria bacterium CG_4_10_14_0_2_um_filter_38_22]PJB10697.1 MAG: MBL fold metallo-hydrolase [Gammaproteobacteria bacterium CG_4_9_14_3_um_filter_38_9]
MKIKFLGATKTVTGSKYLLEIKNKKILIDCGLFQGYKALRLRNWEKFPLDPATIDAVVITHAHIDHTGYLPLLVKNGFQGPIYSTAATYDLCKILLPDSGYLHEEEAKRANKYGYSKHHPALPLYTKEDAEIALKQFNTIAFDKPFSITDQGTVSFHRAGHILGAAFVQFDIEGIRVLFTGDMGRLQDSIMKPPAIIHSTDYLIIESTYGNRLHEKEDIQARIAKIVNETAKRGGTVLIPSFAVGRAQSILYYLFKLKEAGRIPNIPIYLDSPMAINATELLCKYNSEHQLSKSECHLICNVATYVHTPDESKAIAQQPMPKIIISASGMMTGGRILHHLKVFAPDSRNTILMTGYQAGGTRGARMLAGEKETKIHGQMIPVKAQLEYLTNTSAHADYEEMITWLKQFQHPPKKVFITHGEQAGSLGLKDQIEAQLGWLCNIPDYLDEAVLS